MKKLLLSLIALATMAVASSSAQTIFSDSFPTDFNNFTAQNTLSAAGLAWSSDNGVGGVSGRINTSGTANHTNAVFYSGSGSEITKNFTDTFTATIFFQTGASITGDIAHASAGFLRSTGSAFNTLAGGYAFWGEMRNDGGGSYLRLQNTGGQVGSNSSTFSLETNNWYALQASITLSADATASAMSVAIFNVGTSGTDSFGSALASVTATNVSLASGGFTGNLWAGFGGGNNSGSNVAAFDNFSVSAIPEPSAAFFVGLGLVALIIVRRRWRS